MCARPKEINFQLNGTILLTIPNFRTAGSQYVLLSLYHLYKKSNYRTFVVVEDESGFFPGEIDENDRLVLQKKGYLGVTEGIRYSFAFSKIVKQLNIGVVHSWDYRSEIWEALACRIAGIPYVYTKKNNSWSRRWWLKSLLSTHIAYDHPDMGNRFFSKGLLRKKSTLIPHGVNTTLFKPLVKRDLPSFIIGCVGNIGLNKNQMVLLRALLNSDDKIQCRFYGNADREYLELLKKFIDANNLSHRVSFMNYVDNASLPGILSELDILVLASFNEGLPLILLEAMACGVYCIASDSGGGARYIFNMCRAGDLFDPREPEQLAQLIREFYQNRGSKNEISKRAVQNVQNLFSSTKEADNYINLFSKL